MKKTFLHNLPRYVPYMVVPLLLVISIGAGFLLSWVVPVTMIFFLAGCMTARVMLFDYHDGHGDWEPAAIIAGALFGASIIFPIVMFFK